MIALLLTAGQFSIYANSLQSTFQQGDVSFKPDMYWMLSSKWRWNASGIRDLSGWRMEREDWNDTITVQGVAGAELALSWRRIGEGALEAAGDFVIGGRLTDSWKINKENTLSINLGTFRDSKGNPILWVVNAAGLNTSAVVPQMWTSQDYSYREVQFRVSGSDQVRVGDASVDTWVVSYGNLTTGYWSRGGNHSIGYKQETLNYDRTLGILLHAAYRGTYSFETDEYGWNETETYVSNAVVSNIPTSTEMRSSNLPDITFFVFALAAAGLITLATIMYRRKKPHSSDSPLQITC